MVLAFDKLSETDAAGWYDFTDRPWGKVLDDTAARYPSSEAIVFGGERLTYLDFRNGVDRCAKALIAIGIKPGEQVAVWMTNCPEWLIIQFAIYKVGARLIPLNTRFKRQEVQYILTHSDTVALFLSETFLAGKIHALDEIGEIIPEIRNAKPGQWHSENVPCLRHVVCLQKTGDAGALSFDDLLALGAGVSGEELDRRQSAVKSSDVCQIMYTSGTTGAPKGAMIAHRTNQCGLPLMCSRIHLSPSDTILLALPLFTNFGCMLAGGVSIFYGSKVVLQDTFDVEPALRLIERERVNILLGTPTMFIMLHQSPHIKQYDHSSLRAGVMGGAPASVSTIQAMFSELGLRDILCGYGLVEGGGVSAATLEGDTFEHIAGTVGRPLPFCEVKISDPATGAALPGGEQGEVWLRERFPYSHTMLGYYKDEAQTERTIDQEGWLRTGDLGRMDDDGYLSITGRLKEMYLVGGFNVYPAEVENMLHGHPKIKQVAVVGVPDPRLGEVGMAFVVTRDGERLSSEEVIAYSRERIANIKVPRYVHFVQELPLTAAGKVQKFVLQDLAKEVLRA